MTAVQIRTAVKRAADEACWIPDEFLLVVAESLTSKSVPKKEVAAFLTKQIEQE